MGTNLTCAEMNSKNKTNYSYRSFVRPNLTTLSTKEEILACYKLYILRLDEAIVKIQNIRAQNKKLKSIQDECLNDIIELLDESKSQMNQVMTETVWDKLVIAFFGETNAGKSTIIEAFRCKFHDSVRENAIKNNFGKGVDGLIVGDGRSDFTQVYEKYNLSINNESFILIDVPGIEGKEANYLKEIRCALKQAHCVFYVQGHNVKPNAATAEKIKDFLSDWVNVYSIYNVRGGVSNYDEEEERETLMTQHKLEVQNSIEEVFRDILPNEYKGNVSLQGLLALLSVADFHESRGDLIRNQEKIIQYFGTRENVLRFSHFDEIIKLILEQSSNFGKNIIEANRNKLVSLSNRIQKRLSLIIEEKKSKLDSFNVQLESFKKYVKAANADICHIAHNKMLNEVSQALKGLRTSINDIIDDGRNNDEWSSRIKHRSKIISNKLEREILDICTQSQEELYRKIDNKRKDLDNIAFRKFTIQQADITINVDFNGVLDKLSLDLKNIINSFFSSFRNPIGSFIKLFNNPDDGRKDAKIEIGKQIDSIRPEICRCIDSIHSEFKRKLKQEEIKLISSIESEMNNIKHINCMLDNLRKEFDKQ